jgi:hypothetical protein
LRLHIAKKDMRNWHLLLLFLCLSSFAQPEVIGKWRLVEIRMHQISIAEAELQAKRLGNVLVFAGGGVCQVHPDNPRAKVITSRWYWETSKKNPQQKYLIIEARDPVGKVIKQRFEVEKPNRKTMILHIGEGIDRESYVYRALK